MLEMLAKVKAARRELTLDAIGDINASFTSGSILARMEMERAGVIHLGCDLLKDAKTPALIRASAWRWLQSYVIIDDLDDPREFGPHSPIQRVYREMNMFPIAARELEERANNAHIINSVLSFISWCAQDETCIPELVRCEVHLPAIQFLNKGLDSPFLDQSMAVIRALSSSTEAGCRQALVADGALEAVLPFANALFDTRSDHAIRRGFRTASIVIRLSACGKARSSQVGAQLVRGNAMLIHRTVDMLDKVLDAGSANTVYNMGINPHLITMDLLIIAQTYPVLLKRDVVPVLIKALDKRARSNAALVKDVCKIIIELIHAGTGETAALLHSEFPGNIYPKLVLAIDLNPSADLEVRSCFQILREKLMPDMGSSSKDRRVQVVVGLDQVDLTPKSVHENDWMRTITEALRRMDELLLGANSNGGVPPPSQARF